MNPFSFKKRKNKDYFEGYYLRIIDQNKGFNKAFIFGVTYNQQDPHAFIQLVDGDQTSTKYYRFDLDDFSFHKDKVFFGENYLTMDEVYIQTEDFTIQGTLSNHILLNKYLFSNSAMSFMHLFPMKTYQEVVYQDACFDGLYQEKDKELSLHGVSYMEKTYGHKFPPIWIWIQSNLFDQDVKLSCSIGHTKIFGIKALGYVVSLIYKGEEIRFATYKRNKINIEQKEHLKISLSNKKYDLIIKARQSNPITLIGPVDKGLMTRHVYESITSQVEVKLYKNKQEILHAYGSHVGMENMH